MTGWEIPNCANHPDRIAVERCEVCGKPLCAYCLYYTEDGQRLCAQHAEFARQSGLHVEEPGAYADQLIQAQAGMSGKHKRELWEDPTLYKGNSTDVLALVGMLIGVITLMSICGGTYCLPVVGVVLGLIGLLNASKAHDKKRTRIMSVVGLLTSGVWVLVLLGMMGLCFFSFQQSMRSLPYSTPYWFPSAVWPTHTLTPTPEPSTATPTAQDEPAEAAQIITPTPEPPE